MFEKKCMSPEAAAGGWPGATCWVLGPRFSAACPSSSEAAPKASARRLVRAPPPFRSRCVLLLNASGESCGARGRRMRGRWTGSDPGSNVSGASPP